MGTFILSLWFVGVFCERERRRRVERCTNQWAQQGRGKATDYRKALYKNSPPLRLARLHEVDLAVLWPPIPDGELCWL